MTRKHMATILALLVLVGLIGWMIGRSGGSPKSEGSGALARGAASETNAPPLVSDVTQQRLLARTAMGGYIEPLQVVKLTAQMGGRVAYIAGREGVSVQEGQVVVGLDEERIAADYRAAWARLSGDMAGIQNAQVQLYNKLNGPSYSPMGGPGYEAYDRMATPFFNAMREMMPFMGGAPIQPQADQRYSFANRSQARNEYERQQAALVAAQSHVDAIEAQMRDYRGIAPFPAVILAKHVNVGDVVQPGQPLMDIAQTDRLLLKVEVPARLVTEMRPGMMVPVAVDGKLTLDGIVDQIYPAANPTQHTVTVKVLLPPAAPVAPGMYASALLPEPPVAGQSLNALTIPMSAVIYPGSLPSVFAVARDGKAELRVVRLGERQGERVVVLSGVQAGDKVVTAPPRHMRTGDIVQATAPAERKP